MGMVVHAHAPEYARRRLTVSPRLSQRTEHLAEDAAYRYRDAERLPHALVAENQHGRFTLAENEKTLFKARIIPGKVFQIGKMFPVRIDDQVGELSPCFEESLDAILIHPRSDDGSLTEIEGDILVETTGMGDKFYGHALVLPAYAGLDDVAMFPGRRIVIVALLDVDGKAGNLFLKIDHIHLTLVRLHMFVIKLNALLLNV